MHDTIPQKSSAERTPTPPAPIVWDGLSSEGVAPLKRFITHLANSNNTDIAQSETQTLRAYFNTFSNYVQSILPHVSEKHANLLKGTTSSTELSQLFTTVASYTRNTLTTTVAIIPDNLDEGPLWETAHTQRNFFKDYTYGFKSFSFGFYKTFEQKKNRSLVSFPALMLDSQALADIAPHNPVPLLTALQHVFTLVNHDPLHHLTAPVVNGPVEPALIQESADENAMMRWDENLRKYARNPYENWAQIAHERMMLSAGTETLTFIEESINTYANELKRIGSKIQNSGTTANDAAKPIAHVVVDYFGTVMIHALTRLVPLHHPLMLHCVKALEKADPMPEAAFGDLCQTFQIPRRHIDKKEALEWMRDLCMDDPDLAPIIQSYKKAGLEILPKKEGDISYAGCKLLQQIKISFEDVAPHTPNSLDPDIRRLQKGADRLTAGMLVAAKKMSAGYELKKS